MAVIIAAYLVKLCFCFPWSYIMLLILIFQHSASPLLQTPSQNRFVENEAFDFDGHSHSDLHTNTANNHNTGYRHVIAPGANVIGNGGGGASSGSGSARRPQYGSGLERGDAVAGAGASRENPYDSSSSGVSAMDRDHNNRDNDGTAPLQVTAVGLDAVSRRTSVSAGGNHGNNNMRSSSRATLSQIKARQALARQPTRSSSSSNSNSTSTARRTVINYAQHADRFNDHERADDLNNT